MSVRFPSRAECQSHGSSQPNKADSVAIKGLPIQPFTKKVFAIFEELMRILHNEAELDITTTEHTGEHNLNADYGSQLLL